MATNFYFNNFTNSMEQSLIEDLVIESIRIHGIDAWYMPRSFGALDDLLNEDDLPAYNSAFMVEMYIKNVDNFEGEGDFMSKFGLQIRDTVTLTIAQRTFTNEVGQYNSELRPLEGDLVYLPLNRKIFEIKHIEHEAIFYQMGSLQTYDLKMELFEYSNELFNTGVRDIDILWERLRTTGDNTIEGIELIDPLADNKTIEDEADAFLDFSEKNPFGEDNY